VLKQLSAGNLMERRCSTRIDIIRHGEPVGGKRIRGQRDDPLSATGWEQMRRAVQVDQPWDAIVSSPLSRCAGFARELAGNRHLPLHLEERFREIGFGEWEGRTHDELDVDNRQLARFRLDPVNNRPPGAEAVEQFRDRVWAGLTDVHQRFAGQYVLIVAHAGVIRAAISHALGARIDYLFRIKVPYAAITQLEMCGRGDQGLTTSLVFHARTSL
jgi:alpha-ribazole phosphatase/probable phosphoglycerate mutase